MEEEQIDIIRESTRNLLRLNRKTNRDEETDVRRCMENLRISSDSIADIVNKLKTKSSITISELQTLKNGLMNDSKYIEVVLNTHGALRGLVRELSGNEVRKQCAAAGCLCNLALGDARATLTIAKAAGPYLIAGLDNLSTELAVTCAWAVGNIAGGGARAGGVLTSQGAVTKLAQLLEHGDEDIRDAALYALVHLAYQMKDELRREHLQRILQSVSKLDLSMTSSHLFFLLSCHKDFDDMDCLRENLVEKLLEGVSGSIVGHLFDCRKKSCCKLLYLLRILANMATNVGICERIIEYFLVTNMCDSIKSVLRLDSDSVCGTLVWLLGNLYKYCGENQFFNNVL